MNTRRVFRAVFSLCPLFVAALLIAQTTYDQLVALGRLEADAQRYTTAITASDKAITLDPSRWDAYAIKGLAQQQQRDYGSAIVSFSQAVAFAPADKKPTLQRLLEETIAARNGGAAAPIASTYAAPPPQPVAPASFVDIDAYVVDHSILGTTSQYKSIRVPDAEVTARRLDIPQTFMTRTESNGEFRFFHLPAGQYTFEARANGKRYVSPNCCGFSGGVVDLHTFTKENSGLSSFSFELQLAQ